MAYPVTGPFSRNFESNFVGGYPLNNKFSRWFRQRRPYDKALPYQYISRITHTVSDWAYLQTPRSVGGISATQAFDVPTRGRFDQSGVIEALLKEVANRARAKLEAKFSDPASVLTSLLESQSTIDMVTSKLEAFTRFTARWRRGAYKSAIMGILDEQKFRNKRKEALRRRRLRRLAEKPRTTPASKSLASGFIETWFGWLPTIGDVQKSLANLSRDFPLETYRAGSSLEYATADGAHKGRSFCSCGASIKVTNPNLYLASQLGLTNPVYTAFELIPYSWLLAWFGNLEQFFKQWSTYHGTMVDNSWYTWGLIDVNQFDWSSLGWPQRPRGKQSCVSFERMVGIPDVTLVFKGLNRLSVTRGLTLTSLLTLRLSDDAARLKNHGLRV